MTKNMPEKKAAASNTSARGFIWNAIGTGWLSVSSIVLLMVVSNVMGAVEAGIFSIGFAFAQQLQCVTAYELDSFYATDRSNKRCYAQYNGARLLLLIGAGAAAIIMVVVKRYDIYKSMVVLLLCMYKCIDGASRAYYGVLLKNERIDLAGKILTVKIVLSTGLFAAVLIATQNMIASLLVLFISYLLLTLIYEARVSARYEKFSVRVDRSSIMILVECFSFFAGTFILAYIGNHPKYVIDSMGIEELNTIYSIIVMPAFAINLLSVSIFKPMLTGLSISWFEKKHAQFAKKMAFVYAMIVFCTIGCLAIGWIIGPQVLSFFYGVSVIEYRAQLCILLIAGGFNAAAAFAHNVIVVIRKQKVIVPVYAIGLILALIGTKPLVTLYSITGASIAYLVSLFAVTLALLLIILRELLIAHNNRQMGE